MAWGKPHAVKASLLAAGVVIGSAGLFFLMGEMDVTDDYLPKRWNESIRRLGITPVYPPQEDIYVGDIIAEVVDSGHKFKSLPGDLESEAFIGRYVKVTQIPDLRGYLSVKSEAPYFGDNTWQEDKSKLALSQPRTEVANNGTTSGLQVKDVLFPVIKIERREGISGLLRTIGFGGARADVEEIELQNVQTYAINPFHAQHALIQFCAGATTQLLCNDEYIREKLSYILGRDILRSAETKDCGLRYIYDVRLLVVRQAFLTRGVKITNGRGRLVGLNVGAGKPNIEQSQNDVNGAATQPPNETRPDPNIKDISLTENAIRSANSSGLFSDRQFARPLVIGFNAVSLGMRGSTPAWRDDLAKATADKKVKGTVQACATSKEAGK
ncbi:hypothetical protein RP75_16045 [Agrobacterium arsenijevicii]|uniref:Uncharacterized protein n=1 Tax=Agrobacterium arsenijevicii TaxID=1585697 RepID=A0ABR5D577_9HYPH|nr:hypothetical protein RP75_16045 [Agrobacterium arsenijevicii]